MGWQLRIRIACDVQNGIVVGDERECETTERNGQENELCLACGCSCGHPCPIADPRANHWQGGLNRRQQERHNQCELSNFWYHRLPLSIHYSFCCLVGEFFGVIDRSRGLGRHVVLVVLCEHHIRVEHSVIRDFALGHTAATFLKKIGQNTLVNHLNAGCRVGNHEARRESVRLSPEAPFLNQTANSEIPTHWCFFSRDLRWTKKEHEVFLEGAE